MPFSFAHPAIVLPLIYVPRKWVSMTALVIGSIMPDAESYLRMYSHKDITHSWIGFLVFGLPFGLLLTFVFHNIVRNTFVNNLPNIFYEKFSRFKTFDWNKRFLKNWIVVISSLIIGGASHFFWDSFSHYDAWLMRTFPSLQGDIRVSGKLLEIPFLIQYVSTLLGIIVIIVCVAALPRRKEMKRPTPSFKFWIAIAMTATVIFFGRNLFMRNLKLDDQLVGLASAFFYALVIVTMVFPKQETPKLPS